MGNIPYAVAPSLWAVTPIIRHINPITGMIEGDDSGYRKVRTLPVNPAPLVNPAVLCRPSYDGVTILGTRDPSIILPGGLDNGVLVVREAFARDIDAADLFLQKTFGNAYRLCALDGFRSWKRQAAGFTSLLTGWMQRTGVTTKSVNNDEDVVRFLQCGDKADGTFSWVNADTASAGLVALATDLLRDARMQDQLKAYAASKATDGVGDLDDAVYTYITVSANSGIGRAARCNIPLVFEGNAHAGGGACDIFLVGSSGQPLNPVPFDYPGPAAAMDYMENDKHYDEYRKLAATDDMLRAHMQTALGTTPDRFSWSMWEDLRAALRILYHLTRAKGWTYYSSDHGGENWHLEGGNIGYDPLTGAVLFSEPVTSVQYPDSGNPGHTLQLRGRDAVAAWGGATGHEQALRHGLSI